MMSQFFNKVRRSKNVIVYGEEFLTSIIDYFYHKPLLGQCDRDSFPT